jgi:hypothetical protein
MHVFFTIFLFLIGVKFFTSSYIQFKYSSKKHQNITIHNKIKESCSWNNTSYSKFMYKIPDLFITKYNFYKNYFQNEDIEIIFYSIIIVIVLFILYIHYDI